MSQDTRTLYFVGDDDQLLSGRALRVQLHRLKLLPKVFITHEGALTVDLSFTSDDEALAAGDIASRAPRGVSTDTRERMLHDLRRALRSPRAGGPYPRIAPRRAPLPDAHSVLGPINGGLNQHAAPGRLHPSVVSALRATGHAELPALVADLGAAALHDPQRNTVDDLQIGTMQASAGALSAMVAGIDLTPPDAGGADPKPPAASDRAGWWVEVYDLDDAGQPLQAELMPMPPPGHPVVDGDRWFRIGGDLYWRFRAGGVRRELPIGFDVMVHRTADTGRANGGLLGARDPGWRAAFARATGQLPPYERPLPPQHTRCFLSKDAAASLLKLLAPSPGAPEGKANWMRAVLAWTDEQSGEASSNHIFYEYLDALRAGTAPPPDAPEGWWAEAQASWGPRGLFASRPAMLDASAAALEDRLINGMSPHGLAARGEGADRRLLWVRSWDAAHRSTDPGDYVVPDVEVVLLPVEGSALPRVESIRLRSPGEGWVETPRPEHEAPEHDAMDDWSQAKRFVRQAILLSGQLDWHVARGHFFMELHLVALCRSLPTHHPLRVQLWPFLRSVDEINEFGEQLLFSETGLLVRASGLSAAGVNGRLRAQLRGALSDGRPPRPPSCAGDAFSPWAAVAWRATQKYVEEHFTDEVLDDSALSRWAGALLEGLPEVSEGVAPARADALPEGAQWCEAEAPVAWPPTDRAGWRALVHRLIYHATFLHSYVGHQQFEDGGNPLLAPFGLRRPPPSDGLLPRRRPKWTDVAPKAAHAGLQVGMAELLALPRWGMLCEADEPGSHPAEYGALLALLEAELAAARAALPPGAPDPFARFSPQDIRGRINI